MFRGTYSLFASKASIALVLAQCKNNREQAVNCKADIQPSLEISIGLTAGALRLVYGSSGRLCSGTFFFFFLWGRNNKNPDLALFRPNQLIFMAPRRRMKRPERRAPPLMNRRAEWITTPDKAAAPRFTAFDRPREELARWAKK